MCLPPTTWGRDQIRVGQKNALLWDVFTAVTRTNFPENIRHCYRRENIPEDRVLRPYVVFFYGEANKEIIYEATAHEQWLRGNRHDGGSAVTRGSLPRPLCGISPLRAITLKMEALLSSETSVLTRATQCNITEDIHQRNIQFRNVVLSSA
jgi:hypothetical protein